MFVLYISYVLSVKKTNLYASHQKSLSRFNQAKNQPTSLVFEVPKKAGKKIK